MKCFNKHQDLLNKALQISNMFKENAKDIDLNSAFPYENILQLKHNKLMGLIAPLEYGGLEADLLTVSKFVQILGSSCLSTAMIFSMHCQQIYTIANLKNNTVKSNILTNLCKKQIYIASVTSEYKKKSNLLKVDSSLSWLNTNEFLFNRRAPIVTGGQHADAYLITMRRNSSSLENDIALVYTPKEDIHIEVNGKWESMGMRGTQSIPLTLSGTLTKDQIVNEEPFSVIANKYMIPIGHIMWASCWLGAVKNIFQKTIKLIRKNSEKAKSELTLHELAEARLLIETVDTYLDTTILKYNECICNNSDSNNQDWNLINIYINNLKILASENLIQALDILMNICGVKYGYLLNEEIPLERTYRDLKSSSLMFNNDKLKEINGKLSLFRSNLFDY
ncbi:Acryloyl-CoA reductase (NADH) [Bacillus sp. M21]|uniref:acyl-CoA dehydrogenase family protein n=1 Tax=Bacillus sp. M21 TaxID=1155617 RepID=UPI000D4B4188|nr:acyl-CoA dehydrogenase family protein [Bacillus sp. M21]PRP92098.1 Acryloyl-CoA reductase (NADH) [Bacillus sp. M21]